MLLLESENGKHSLLKYFLYGFMSDGPNLLASGKMPKNPGGIKGKLGKPGYK